MSGALLVFGEVAVNRNNKHPRKGNRVDFYCVISDCKSGVSGKGTKHQEVKYKASQNILMIILVHLRSCEENSVKCYQCSMFFHKSRRQCADLSLIFSIII